MCQARHRRAEANALTAPAVTQWRDTPAGYGLVSILLHWSGAIVVIAMLVIGNVMAASTGADWQHYLRLHTTVAILAYPLLVWRIVWRVRSRHPAALPRQNPSLLRLAVFVHYSLIMLIASMLVSGQLMAWAGGLPVTVFDVSIPGPFPPDRSLFQSMRVVHATAATALMALIGLHIAAALFHIIFRKDRTLDKILLPAADIPPA